MYGYAYRNSFGFTYRRHIVKRLREYGFNVSIKRANKFSNKEKINILKNEINKNHPVILLVSSNCNEQGKYVSKKNNENLGHWISLWGYNESDFFVYDSAVAKKYYDKIPIGNSKRSYKDIIKIWKGSSFFRFSSYLYIPIIKE